MHNYWKLPLQPILTWSTAYCMTDLMQSYDGWKRDTEQKFSQTYHQILILSGVLHIWNNNKSYIIQGYTNRYYIPFYSEFWDKNFPHFYLKPGCESTLPHWGCSRGVTTADFREEEENLSWNITTTPLFYGFGWLHIISMKYKMQDLNAIKWDFFYCEALHLI